MLGENIKRIRTERHMTQTALAEKAGVTVQMINQIEWGVKKMSIDNRNYGAAESHEEIPD